MTTKSKKCVSIHINSANDFSLVTPVQDTAKSERRDGEDTDPCEYPAQYCAVQPCTVAVQWLTDAHST